MLTLTTLPLWGLLVVLSLFALGLGTTFPVSVVSLQNSVARAQIGTVTGAMNFFRALMSSFTVAAFSAILLMALGADISLGEHRGPVNAIPVADMITAFRYVFGAAAALMAGAALCMILMEERPLAGPLDAGRDGGVGRLLSSSSRFRLASRREKARDRAAQPRALQRLGERGFRWCHHAVGRIALAAHHLAAGHREADGEFRVCLHREHGAAGIEQSGMRREIRGHDRPAPAGGVMT